jgi:hypothetical protein
MKAATTQGRTEMDNDKKNAYANHSTTSRMIGAREQLAARSDFQWHFDFHGRPMASRPIRSPDSR